MTVRLHRFQDAASLHQGVAANLAAAIRAAKAQRKAMALCLSDRLNAICSALDACLDPSDIRSGQLSLWWSNEAFVDLTNPARVSTKTMAKLGQTLRFAPGKIHPMPTASGNSDVDAAALQYAEELRTTAFRLTVLAMGSDGSVAGLRPGSPGLSSPNTVIGLRDDDREYLSLTLKTLARSTVVWLIATGKRSARSLARALAGDEQLPAGLLRGRAETHFFADQAAASKLEWHNCGL